MSQTSLVMTLHLMLVACLSGLCGSVLAVDDFVHSQWFSTKSPYWPQQDFNDWQAAPPSCEPVLLEGLVRHGARNPGGGDIKAMKALEELLRTHRDRIVQGHAGWALEWQSAYQPSEQHLLVEAGERELYGVAQRMKRALPMLLSQPYSHTRYGFQATQTSRTAQSAAAFTYGLFEGTGALGTCRYQPVGVLSDSLSRDFNLRFFDACPRYLDLLSKGHGAEDLTLREFQQIFRQTDLFMELRQNLTEALGLDGYHTLTDKEVHGIYRACSYDTVQGGEISQWCRLLGEKGLRIMEYHDDLKQWWRKGYGHPLNYHMACPLLSDMFSRVDDALARQTDLKAFIRFGHAETVVPLITLLGLFNSTFPFAATASYEALRDRDWRSSYITPFSANVFFVFYRCGDDSPVVKLLVNEKEYRFPGCDELYCPVDKVRHLLDQHLTQCNFHGLCGHPAVTETEDVPDIPSVTLGDVLGLAWIYLCRLIGVQ